MDLNYYCFCFPVVTCMTNLVVNILNLIFHYLYFLTWSTGINNLSLNQQLTYKKTPLTSYCFTMHVSLWTDSMLSVKAKRKKGKGKMVLPSPHLGTILAASSFRIFLWSLFVYLCWTSHEHLGFGSALLLKIYILK